MGDRGVDRIDSIITDLQASSGQMNGAEWGDPLAELAELRKRLVELIDMSYYASIASSGEQVCLVKKEAACTACTNLSKKKILYRRCMSPSNLYLEQSELLNHARFLSSSLFIAV